MNALKVPTPYIKKLKELGVYDLWLANVKRFWETREDSCLDSSTLNRCMNATFEVFISNSFTWSRTDEGFTFWADISDK